MTAPLGFEAAGVHCGLKRKNLDLGLICSRRAAVVAGVFTTNQVVAAPVIVSRAGVRAGRARAIVVNSGGANACTGAGGLADAREMAAVTAKRLGLRAAQVLVASTGVIGERLKMDRVRAGIAAAAAALGRDGSDVARAILTTDTRPKVCAVRSRAGYSIGGIAKGAGMIAPKMATMLAFLTTDAWVERRALQAALTEAVAASFNAVTVDGDTSTNDTVLLLANGASAGRGRARADGGPTFRSADRPIKAATPAYREFVAGLTFVAQSLAVAIAADGEGATRLVRVLVRGARRPADASRVARTIAESPLVKTAINGGDPNWGRIVAAAGRAGVPLRPERLSVAIGRATVFRAGRGIPAAEAAAHRALLHNPVDLTIELHLGPASATVWTCDLSEEYVRINAHYRT